LQKREEKRVRFDGKGLLRFLAEMSNYCEGCRPIVVMVRITALLVGRQLFAANGFSVSATLAND
jgi:hypothetical protein